MIGHQGYADQLVLHATTGRVFIASKDVPAITLVEPFAIMPRTVYAALDRIISGGRTEDTPTRHVLPLPADQRARLAGRYTNGALTIELEDRAGQLVRRDHFPGEPDEPAMPVRKVGDNRYETSVPGRHEPRTFMLLRSRDGAEFLFSELIAARRQPPTR